MRLTRSTSGPRAGLPLRRGLFWLHLVVGLLAGSVILAMSLTGVALTYEPQVVAWMERPLNRVPNAGEARLALDDLAAPLVDAAAGGVRVESVVVGADPAAPVEVRLSDRTVHLLDPYTGEARGPRAERTRAVFAWITRFHRWFALEGEARNWARAVTGAANLAFLFLLLSGLYLWWPRRVTARALRAVGLLRLGARGRVRDFNWHHVFGFWSAIPLVIVVASATVFHYGWANDLAYRLAGDVPPGAGRAAEGPAGPSHVEGPAATRPVPATVADVDRLLPEATALMPAWRTVTVQVPADSDRLRFTLDAGNGGQPHLRATATLSSASGAVVEWAPFDSLSPGRRFRSVLRFAHTGEVWGWIGQTLAGLASLAGVVLVWTGTALGLRRLFGGRAVDGSEAASAGSSLVADTPAAGERDPAVSVR